MNNQARKVRKNNHLVTWLAGLASAAALVGCSGDGSVGVGSGQDPDPVALDFPVAYVKAPVPIVDPNVQQQPTDVRNLRTFNIGADLFIRDRASPSAVETNVTESITQGLGDVRDVEISEDGERVLFAMRAQFIPNADEEDQPTWNIWEYDIPSQVLRRVIASDIFAEDGHDVAPQYLPDGRILFSSTRQRQSKATLLDEGKPQYEGQDEDRNEPAFVLHVMEIDGSNIRQISFNQSHDLEPAVLSNGKVLFSRWDNAGPVSGIHLYQVNPDGSDLELLYGANSHFTGTNGAEVHFLQPREMPDGQVMAIMRPFAGTGTDFGGDIVIIDAPTYVDNTQPTASNQGMTGPAQAAATINVVTTDLAPSPGGRFASAFPLWDGTDRILVAWSQCRLEENMVIVPCTTERLADPNAVAAPPLYGIWMYDMAGDTQIPVVAPEEGIMVTEVVAAQPRPTPNVIPDRTPGVELDMDLATENVGILNIRSVYDIDGVAVANIAALADPAVTTSASQRPARFLRIEKAVSLPDQDTLDFRNTAFGRSAQQGMREVLAYAMIEPDGSVMTKVPANVPFAISVLDENGRRITPRHQNWLQVQPGDTLTCNGCHDPASGLSHGRKDSFDSAYAGAATMAQPFPNTNSAIFADMGETMAEARMRVMCGASLSTCAEITPSVDIRFDDVWTDPLAANRAVDASFAYRYADVMQPPTTAACINTWEANCRIVINYEMHIHPLWTQARQILDPVDPNIVLVDNTCTRCHGTADAAGNLQAPAASLNLENGLSNQVTDHFESYRQLMFQRTALMLDAVNMVLVPQTQVVGTDPVTGAPIVQNIVLNPPMNVAAANFSNNFFLRFDANGTHTFVDPTDGLTKSYLTGGELKMIAEWLDIGGQYFNNPFDAPVN